MLQFIYLHIFPLIIQILTKKEQQLHVDSAQFERTKALRLRTVNNKLLAGMTKYRVDCVNRILPVRRPINYRVDCGTMIMTC